MGGLPWVIVRSLCERPTAAGIASWHPWPACPPGPPTPTPPPVPHPARPHSTHRQVDDEASIRANTTVLLGNLANHLSGVLVGCAFWHCAAPTRGLPATQLVGLPTLWSACRCPAVSGPMMSPC